MGTDYLVPMAVILCVTNVTRKTMLSESNVQSILNQEKRGMHRKRTFNNFGFSLIFSEGDNITSFEIDYGLFCDR